MQQYSQPHPRFSVLSGSSLSSAELLSPTASSTRFSLPSAPSINTALGTSKSGARPNIYDRNINKTRTSEVSASALAFLFSEVIQYTQKRVSGINDLERRSVHIAVPSPVTQHTVVQIEHPWLSRRNPSPRAHGLARRVLVQSPKTRNSVSSGSHGDSHSGMESSLWTTRRCNREECRE